MRPSQTNKIAKTYRGVQHDNFRWYILSAHFLRWSIILYYTVSYFAVTTDTLSLLIGNAPRCVARRPATISTSVIQRQRNVIRGPATERPRLPDSPVSHGARAGRRHAPPCSTCSRQDYLHLSLRCQAGQGGGGAARVVDGTLALLLVQDGQLARLEKADHAQLGVVRVPLLVHLVQLRLGEVVHDARTEAVTQHVDGGPDAVPATQESARQSNKRPQKNEADQPSCLASKVTRGGVQLGYILWSVVLSQASMLRRRVRGLQRTSWVSSGRFDCDQSRVERNLLSELA